MAACKVSARIALSSPHGESNFFRWLLCRSADLEPVGESQLDQPSQCPKKCSKGRTSATRSSRISKADAVCLKTCFRPVAAEQVTPHEGHTSKPGSVHRYRPRNKVVRTTRVSYQKSGLAASKYSRRRESRGPRAAGLLTGVNCRHLSVFAGSLFCQ